MAIFGNFKDMPFPDLVAMLGRRSGVLEVFGLPGKRQGYAVALDGGKVVWVREGRKLLDPVEARFALQELMRSGEGAFEFTPGVPPANGVFLGWPLERLLLSVTTMEDELTAYAPLLPDPKTRFQVASLEVWLEEPLWSFWERAKGLLQGGLRRGDRQGPSPPPGRGALLPPQAPPGREGGPGEGLRGDPAGRREAGPLPEAPGGPPWEGR